MIEVNLIVGLVLIVAAVARVVLKRNTKASSLPVLDALPDVTARATALIDMAATDTGSGSVPPEERKAAPTKSSRDEREKWLRERAKHMHCRYCDDRAVRQFPRLEPITSVFDPVLRYFNATPNRRWAIQITPAAGAPFELCARHHEQVLGFFEETVAAERQSYTRFASEQRTKMYEFERYGADERAVEEMTALRADKKKPRTSKAEGRAETPKNGKVLTFRKEAANGSE